MSREWQKMEVSASELSAVQNEHDGHLLENRGARAVAARFLMEAVNSAGHHLSNLSEEAKTAADNINDWSDREWAIFYRGRAGALEHPLGNFFPGTTIIVGENEVNGLWEACRYKAAHPEENMKIMLGSF